MIILALDASSTHIGYCIGEDADYVISGVFVPKGRADERVAQIVTWALDKIRRYEPDIVVIEEPAANNSHRNTRTDRLLSRACGAIEAVVICSGCKFGRVWPSQVKATGCSKDSPRFAAGVAHKDSVGPDEDDAVGGWLAWLTKGGGSAPDEF